MFVAIQNVREETMERIARRHEEFNREIEKILEEGNQERRTKNADKLDMIGKMLNEI